MRTISTFLLGFVYFSFTTSAQTNTEMYNTCPQAAQHLEVPSQIRIEGKSPKVAFLFSDSGIDVYLILEPPINPPHHREIVVRNGLGGSTVLPDNRSSKETGDRYSGEALWVYQDETARRETVKLMAMSGSNPPLGFDIQLFTAKLKFVTFHLWRRAGMSEVFGRGTYYEPAECGPAIPYTLVPHGPNLKVRDTNAIGWDEIDDIPRDGSKRAIANTGLLLYRTERAMEAKERWKEHAK
jgi:hypothetical protein